MEINENFIILRKGRFKEVDLWLKVLSPHFGLTTFFAFGGLVSKKRFCGCLDEFNLLYGKIEKSKRKEYLTLKESYLINKFIDLKQNSSKIGAIANITKFLEKIKITPDEYKQVFDLFVNFISIISKVSDISYFPLLFKANLIFNLGYLPLFSYCLHCKKPLLQKHKIVFFSFQEGGFFCVSCGLKKGLNFKLDSNIILFLKYISQSKPKDWIQIDINKTFQKACYEIVSRFIEYHLEISI